MATRAINYVPGANNCRAYVFAQGGDVTIPAAAFTGIPMNYFAGRISGGAWDSGIGGFVIPEAGIYDITGSVRAADGQAIGKQFGIGIHSTTADGAWFLWHGILANRCTYPYARKEYFNAGDVVRMFCYADTGIVLGVCAMQIMQIA